LLSVTRRRLVAGHGTNAEFSSLIKIPATFADVLDSLFRRPDLFHWELQIVINGITEDPHNNRDQ
jgi:hypothetical protein